MADNRSLGHLVIISMRLGLRWRRISLFDGLQATGTIGSISSTMIPGLGTIAFFNFTVGNIGDLYFRLLAPSQAADKLMCGVIPATTDLKICTREGKDIPLVDDDRTLKPMRDFLRYDVVDVSHRLPKEDLHEILMNSITKRHRPSSIEWWARAAVFDAWCMLCPFVPVDNSSVVNIILPLPGEHMRTPLNYAGGRQILSLLFRDKFQPREKTDVNAAWVQILLDGFETLDRQFAGKKSDYQDGNASKADIIRRIALLRKIHNETSEQLAERQVSVPAFVGVHIMTVMSASRRALSNWNNDLDKVNDNFLIRNSIPEDLINKNRMHLLAYCYEYEVASWRGYARDRDTRLMDALRDDGDLLWWTLVLRAMCWALSVRVYLSGGLYRTSQCRPRSTVIRRLSGSCRIWNSINQNMDSGWIRYKTRRWL